MNSLLTELRRAFAAVHGERAGVQLALAPGRVNLIGEHTDYNDGFVLPMAIDRYVGVAFAPRDDGQVYASSTNFGEHGRLRLEELTTGHPKGWLGYVAGVLWALREAGFEPRGMDLVVAGNVPVGAGLSSSAALEMAVARAACTASGIEWIPARMALIGQTAERDFVGVSCGIMDQFASALAADGCALRLDCRTLETQLVRIPTDAMIVVMDTGVRRTLAGSAYNERYARCQEAARIARESHPGIRALRDLSPEQLAGLQGRMDPVTYRRARHVVEETLRPEQMADALERGDLSHAGRLMRESHSSLRELYEVSSAELDTIVELADRHSACFGARLTGAGFGGCAIALVERRSVADFVDSVTAGYRTLHDHPVKLFACEPSAGAHIAS